MRHTKTALYWPIVIAIALLSLILSACGPSEPAIDIDAQRTGFAQTADAQASMTAQSLPSATPTPEPIPTETPTPETTLTPSGTETETEGETPTEPPTSTPGGGADAARWMANDPPDNTNFEPGESFTVTWTLENIGTSTWTTQYYIQFVSGEQMGVDPEKKFTLPYPVSPNTNVQISVDFVAPGETGEKRSNWRLVNASDTTFYEFYIIIDVVPPGETEEPEPTLTVTPTP